MPKDVNAAVATIKTKRTIQFVDWHLAGIFIPKRVGARFCKVQDVEDARLTQSRKLIALIVLLGQFQIQHELDENFIMMINRIQRRVPLVLGSVSPQSQ